MWYNDYDKHAVSVYNKQFGTRYEPTDITTVRPDVIPKHTLICAGFPCPSFSQAGKRKGFDDIRGNLFFEIMRIAKHHRTPYLFLENVKGLLSADNGRCFATILNTLDECGYDVQWQVLNTKFFGIPQNRERVFIVANLRSEPRPEVFPFTINAGQVFDVYDEETRGEETSVFKETSFDTGHRNFRESKGAVPTLTAQMGSGGNNQPFIVDEIPEVGTVDLYHLYHGEERPPTSRIMADGNSATLQASQPPTLINNKKLRKLTPMETERIQSFPDSWTELGLNEKGETIKISDTQRYRQMGNAISVCVVEEIVKRFNKSLEQKNKKSYSTPCHVAPYPTIQDPT